MKKHALSVVFILLASVVYGQTIFQEKGKYGIKDTEEILVKPVYDSITILEGGIEFDPETFEEIDNIYSYLLWKGNKYQVVMRDLWTEIFPKKGLDNVFIDPTGQMKNMAIAQNKGKLGLIDMIEVPTWAIEPSYYGLVFYNQDYLMAKKGDKWGMVDLEMSEVVKFEFNEILPSPVPVAFHGKKEGKFKLYGWEGGEIYELVEGFEFDSLKSEGNGYYSFFREGKAGLMNTMKGIVIPAKYNQVAVGAKIMEEGDDFGDFGFDGFGNGWNDAESQIIPQEHAQVMLGNLKGLFKLNDDGGTTKIFSAAFEDYRFKDQFSLSQFLLKKSGKWGFFYPAEMELKDVEYPYSDAKFSGFNIIFEEENGKKGVMDLTGTIIAEAIYDEIKMKNQQSQLYQLIKNGETTYLTNATASGNFTIYEDIKQDKAFYGVIAKKNGKFGAISSVGKTPNILPFIYDDIVPLGKSFFKVNQNGKWGIVSSSGKNRLQEIIPITYQQISQSNCQKTALFFVEKEGKKGIFNPDGKALATITYDSISCLSKHFIVLQKDNTWTVLPISQPNFATTTDLPEYEELKETNFSEILRVKKNGKWGMIRRGQEILPIQFDEIKEYISKGYVSVKQNGKWGEYQIEYNEDMAFISAKESIPAIYDKIEIDANIYEYKFVKREGKYGLYNKERELILPLEYDFLRYETKTSLIGKKGDKTGSIDLATGEMTVKNPFDSQFPLKWKTEIGQTVFRTNIMLANGQIVVGSNGEERNKADSKDGLFLLDAKSGKVTKLISPQSEGKIDVNGQAIDGDRIYFANENSKAFCYDFTGSQLWQANIEGEVENSPALADLNADGTKDAVFTTDMGNIYALDGETGKLIWQTKLEGDQYAASYFMATPLCYDLSGDGLADVIVTPGGRGGVYALNGKDGSALWTFNKTSGIHASPIIMEEKGGLVVAFGSYGGIYFFNKKGEQKRYINFPIGLFAQPLFTPNNRLVAGLAWWDGKDNSVLSKAIDNEDEWEEKKGVKFLPEESPKKSYPSVRISSTGFVADVLGNGTYQTAYASETGELFLLDENGDLLQSLQLPAGVEAPLFVKDIDGDGKLEILIACLDGYLYCFETNSTGKVFHGQFRGDNLNSAVIEK